MKKDSNTDIDFDSDRYLEVFDELPFWAAPFGLKLLDNIKIIEGRAENIPLDNNSIDLIASNNGMNNVADLDKSLSECSRILKKRRKIDCTKQ